MKYLSIMASLPYLLFSQSGVSKPIWDVTVPGFCSYNQTLGSSMKCLPFDSQRIYDSPLEAHGDNIPPFFGYSFSFSYVFTCKREVGLSPLSAEIAISDKQTNGELSKLKISPTTSIEVRKLSVKLNKNKIQASVKITPSASSSFYNPCYFEILEPELTPDFESLEWYADNLIDARKLSQKIEETLADALTKPDGWERAEQLRGDLEAYESDKRMECSRSIRKLSRKLKLDPASLTSEDNYQIVELSGYEATNIPITPEQLNDPEASCSGLDGLQISGKIGNLIVDIANLKDAKEKAQIFSSLNECQSEISQICRSKVESFRSDVLNQIKSQQKSREDNFMSYLADESTRLANSQKEMSERVKGLFDEIKKQ